MTSAAVRLVVVTSWWCAGALAAAGKRDGPGGHGGHGGHDGYGTALYGPADAAKSRWTDRGRTDLQCRMLVGRLVPTRTPDDAAALVRYLRLIGDKARRMASASATAAGTRRRASLALADAVGGYLYAEALPRVRMMYYEGRSNYSTTVWLHDLLKNIKYVLDTDGRGWARPMAAAAAADEHDVAGEKGAARTVAALVIGGIGGPPDDARCGGVDAGPYGLERRRRRRQRRRRRSDDESGWTDDPLPYFDNDTRPHSLVVPWRPGRPVLYSVRDAACHRALFDHCARSAAAAATARAPPEGHATAADRYARDLSAWLRDAARPLMTPAAAARRWYPGLWAVRPVARLLNIEAGADDGPSTSDDDDEDGGGGGGGGGRGRGPPPDAPNVYFYAAAVLTSAAAVWTVGGCVMFRGCWLRCLCAVCGHALCGGYDDDDDDDDDGGGGGGVGGGGGGGGGGGHSS